MSLIVFHSCSRLAAWPRRSGAVRRADSLAPPRAHRQTPAAPATAFSAPPPRSVSLSPFLRQIQSFSRVCESGYREGVAAAASAASAAVTEISGGDSGAQLNSGSSKEEAAAPQPSAGEGFEVAGVSGVAGPLPEALTASFPDRFPTMSAARKACRKKLVRICGVAEGGEGEWRQGKCIDQVEAGQPIEVLERDYKQSQRSSVTVPVVYEDQHMAVIEKPPGFMIHGRGRKTIKHVLGGSLAPSSEPDALLRPHPVHRLDKLTGGLLVCAKTQAAAVSLSQSFEERRVSKTYHALVAGELPSSGEVEVELDGKSALTRYRVLSRSRSLRFEGHMTLVELKPHTGRKHQLRKHMAILGHPIIGDGLYSDQDDEQMRLQHQGLFLWAVGLTIEHPVSGDTMHFSTPPPKKFGRFISAQQGRWERFAEYS